MTTLNDEELPFLGEEPHCVHHGQEDAVWVHDHEEPTTEDPVPIDPTAQPENIIVQSISLNTDHGSLAVASPDEGIKIYRILKEHWPELKSQIIITL